MSNFQTEKLDSDCDQLQEAEVINTQDNNTSLSLPAGGSSKPSFFQERLRRFGLNIVVMGASVALYYLGFFGRVDGPLNPNRIGVKLAALGFTGRHLLITLLTLLIVAITWNWLYNIVCRLSGRRMTCLFHSNNDPACCALPVRSVQRGLFVCNAGHRCTAANFYPLKKGAFAHFVWMMLLIFSVIVYYLS